MTWEFWNVMENINLLKHYGGAIVIFLIFIFMFDVTNDKYKVPDWA